MYVADDDVPLVVHDDEMSDRVKDYVHYQHKQVALLREEIVQLNKKLCKYEGHLLINDSEGRTWCELCQEEI